jgi:hypothetical protein
MPIGYFIWIKWKAYDLVKPRSWRLAGEDMTSASRYTHPAIGGERAVSGSQGRPNFRHMRFPFCRDLAYLGGSTGGGSIRWGGWVGGLFLCLLYVSLAVLITAGAARHSIVLSLIATAGLVIYSLIRALTPDADSGA